MNIQWDAGGYTQNFGFVHRYGTDVVELLGDVLGKTVLDLGCGNGALTRRLADLGATAVGIDASAELLAVARSSCPNLTFLCADATSFSLDRKVDAVFSNAVFHWIDRERQPLMLRCVADALREGGEFVFEMGGFGNNAKMHTALESVFTDYGFAYRMPFYFPTVGEYASLLEQAGFRVKYATLFDRMTELNGPDGLADWIRMFVKTPFRVVPAEQEPGIIDRAVQQLKSELCRDGTWYADYVRLRMKAQ